MRIAVLGAGAMGSWFGGHLALQENAVQLLTTNTAHHETISKNGLILKGPSVNGQINEQRVSVTAGPPNAIQAPVDLILLMTKAFQTTNALSSIEAAIDHDTHILSLQNGVGNAEAIGEFISPERVWVGVSMMPIDKVAPGIVEGKGHGISYFGNAANNDNIDNIEMAKRIESTFQNANIELHHDANIQKRIWEKLAFNAGMNALSALSRGTPGAIGASKGAKQLAQDVAKEVANVANTLKIDVNLEHVNDMITLSCTKHGDHIPSMLQDLQLGRRTEVDALNGAVTQIASRASVAAPLNKTLTTLIKLAEFSNQSQQPEKEGNHSV